MEDKAWWAEFVSKEKMVHGLINMEYINKFCESCVLGKKVRTKFQKKVKYRVRIFLELVHTDTFDPITLKSFSEKM